MQSSTKVFWGAVTISALMLLTAVFLLNVPKADANPTRFSIVPSCSTQGTSATSLSTTTLSYVNAGTGTTTATCNMGRTGLGTELYDEATFFVAQTGSSTLATLNIDIQDSYNGVDWYSRSLGWNVDGNTASSSPSLSGVQSFVSTFSSTTPDKSAVTSANSTVSYKQLSVPVKAPFIRAIITAPSGSTQSGVWGGWAGVVRNP